MKSTEKWREERIKYLSSLPLQRLIDRVKYLWSTFSFIFPFHLKLLSGQMEIAKSIELKGLNNLREKHFFWD